VTFGHPLLLLTLLVVPLAVVLYRLAERRRMRYAIRYSNVEVLASVAGRGSWRRHVPLVLFLAALAALCVGFARPHRTTKVPEEKATVILVIDVSRSMTAHDVKPSRLAAAQAAVRLFLKKAPKRLRVGLIAFAGEPQVVAQPTQDHELVSQALNGIEDFGGFGGTAIGDALAAAVQLGQQAVNGNGNFAAAPAGAAGSVHGLVTILFLSDGAQTRGLLQPLEGAERAKAAGIPVYTVALGTPNGTLTFDNGFGGGFGGGLGGGFGSARIPVPPDPATLRQIAQVTGGQFFEARSEGAVKKAYSRLGSSLGRKRAKTEITSTFLLIAACLLVAAGVLSARWSPRLP